jgi:Fe-S-cluster-containing hydrogenase component 2/CRP-like cAMP-binding protein
MPRAGLETRPGDLYLSEEQLLRLSLFGSLGRKPNLARYPGAVVLRTFHAGETVCWQGEPGWTAFFVLTSEDLLVLWEDHFAQGLGDPAWLCDEIYGLRRKLEGGNSFLTEESWREVGTVHLAFPRKSGVRKPDLGRLVRAGGRPVPGTAVPGRDLQTLYLPVDGPPTLSYDTMRAPLREGELFGESSCLYRLPRPATVVLTRDCYILEFLRNILDQLYRDPAFREGAEQLNHKRAAVEFRKLSLFADLTDEQFGRIRSQLELLRVEPGTVIRDEHETADGVYLVYNGMIQVARNVSSLISVPAVTDWVALSDALREGTLGRSTSRARLWELMGELRPDLRWIKLEPHRYSAKDHLALVDALNAVLIRPGLIDEPDFQSLVTAWPLRETLKGLHRPAAEGRGLSRDLTDRDVRRRNRLLLEAIVPGSFRPLAEQGGPPTILAYCSRGEWFGERGVLEGRPHDTTFTAHGHPNHDGLVGLVRVPAATFGRMLGMSPEARDRVRIEAKRRYSDWERLMRSPLWEDVGPAPVWPAFEELGLMQGQQLMLIDLERCTRCGDCVKACAETHSDGAARIVLDGPRLGKYLVPTTCRSCLDPVCLTGCPVGSIHRGAGGEIVIEDWCIGCGLCAENCPYGSIQMRDVGLIPERGAGWRLMPQEVVKGEGWRRRGFKDSAWLAGETPVFFERDLVEQLASQLPAGRTPKAVLLRYTYSFSLVRDQGVRFRMEWACHAPSVTVWLNGAEVNPEQSHRHGRSFCMLGEEGGGPRLLAGLNALAVRLELPTGRPGGEMLFHLRLDEVRPPKVLSELPAALAEEVTEKQVTHRAATCDLCHGLPHGEPACVRSCAHQAAMRVNARTNFPQG